MQSVHSFMDMLQQFVNGNGLYAIVGIAFLLFLYYLKKRERYVALVVCLLLIVLLYNPASYQLLGEKLGFKATYYRFLWIIPDVPLFAYLIYEAIRHIENKRHRMLLVCVMCIGILSISINLEDLALPDNACQIPDETMEVAEELRVLMEENNEDSTVIIADLYISNAIRQYDANICFPFIGYGIGYLDPEYKKENAFGLMGMLMYNRNDIPSEVVCNLLETEEVDYLVIGINNDISLAYMQSLHWQIVATTSAYHILQYQEPIFNTVALQDAGLELEPVEVIIPGLTEEYHFLCLADLHIIVESEEIAPEEREMIQGRLRSFSNAVGIPSAEQWEKFPELLNACKADGILFGGDMIDFCSRANAESLKNGLDRLNIPYMYVRADHDYAPVWCTGITDEDCVSMHRGIDGYEDVSVLEFPELSVVGINNSTGQMTENGLERIKEIFALGKPVVLLTHVPVNSLVDSSLTEEAKKVWQDRDLVWGEDCHYKPNETTKEFLGLVYAEDSPVKEILSGHLHFSWDGALTENTNQHVFAPSCGGRVGVITVKGE